MRISLILESFSTTRLAKIVMILRFRIGVNSLLNLFLNTAAIVDEYPPWHGYGPEYES